MHVDVNALQDWAEAKPNRSCTIEIRRPGFGMEPLKTTIWVYDWELAVGQFVTSASEIDLEEIAVQKAVQDVENAQKVIDRAQAEKNAAQEKIEKAKEGQHGARL